jgi:hypothetical protein
MIIDCDDCALQGTAACDDCVVTVLLELTGPVQLSGDEAEALHHLADAGMVAPIRLVPRHRRRDAAAG